MPTMHDISAAEGILIPDMPTAMDIVRISIERMKTTSLEKEYNILVINR